MPAPACLHGAVAVGAVYSRAFGAFTAPNICREETQVDQVACFSNSSAELDLLAAGAPIDAIGLDSNDTPIVGTSAASAEAAGAAAVLLQADPSLTPDRLVTLLESTGVPVTDLRAHLTTPRIDLAAALGALLWRAIPLPAPPAPAPPVVAPPLVAPTVPEIGVSTSRISFGSVKPPRAASRRLIVRNSGTGFLTVRVATAPSAVSARPAKLTIEAGGRRTITVSFRPAHAGLYRGQLRLRTDDPIRPTVTVPVRGTGTGR
jgi:subtilisin family serine protease